MTDAEAERAHLMQVHLKDCVHFLGVAVGEYPPSYEDRNWKDHVINLINTINHEIFGMEEMPVVGDQNVSLSNS